MAASRARAIWACQILPVLVHDADQLVARVRGGLSQALSPPASRFEVGVQLVRVQPARIGLLGRRASA
jgi:hypothetical protein